VSLRATVETSAFFEQRFSFLIGEECHLIVLCSWLLCSTAATPCSVDRIYVHRVVIAPPAFPFAFQSLFPLVPVMPKEWVSKHSVVLCIGRVVRSR
jgi:hypothetical protein